ncbi:response regulator [Paenibacillus psychroresistens]|uniref:Response regulator n=1 Tax=Paenibacillus psychroresistens TaxID=1778678 RepID=A0A6B8RD99_9BACL|nr:response regulator [Paenibacillus psychroresistens]QGQ93907.1 response regulator [Paenibacillus psychroresistens]
MLRVFLVDDEVPVLDLLERLLMVNGNIEIAGKFTRPEEAIDRIQVEMVDVIFLDIKMPGMNGIAAAAYLRMVNPETEIVFLTAHNQYAIEAFELKVSDYLLKPPTLHRLNKTIERLLLKRRLRNQEERCS